MISALFPFRDPPHRSERHDCIGLDFDWAIAMALDFAAMLKAERVKTRGNPAMQSGVAPLLTSAESSSLQFCLPQTDSRPQLSAAHRVQLAPPTVWHMADWVTADEEAALMRCTSCSPPQRWTQLRGRRLQNLGGLPRPLPEGFASEPLPGWIGAVCDALVRSGVFPPTAPPNHVLLNEYQPGEGIDAHRDGPLYAPRVAIVSLGSACSFDFVTNDVARDVRASLLLPPRGVLIFSEEAYESLLHTVPALTTDADRQGLIRLDAAANASASAPTDTPEDAFANVPRADVAENALRVGGYETFLRAVRQRTQDAGATPPASPPPASPPPPPPPPLPPRSRRISLTVRRVVSVQSAEQAERMVGRPWEKRSPSQEQAALAQWLGETGTVRLDG